jgi:hypothetical protein
VLKTSNVLQFGIEEVPCILRDRFWSTISSVRTSLNYRRREEPSLVLWNPFSFLLSSAVAIAGRRLRLRGWGLSAAPPCRCVRPSSSGQLLPLLRAAGGWSTWCSSTLDLLPPQAVTSFRLFTASLYLLQLKQVETNLHPSSSCVWPLMCRHVLVKFVNSIRCYKHPLFFLCICMHNQCMSHQTHPEKQTWSPSYGSWWLGHVCCSQTNMNSAQLGPTGYETSMPLCTNKNLALATLTGHHGPANQTATEPPRCTTRPLQSHQCAGLVWFGGQLLIGAWSHLLETLDATTAPQNKPLKAVRSSWPWMYSKQ